ncbi:MAG: YncE family protein, partial [Cytophagales bacterium]
RIVPEKPDNFKNGFFVVCEGTYGFGNASVSYYDNEKKQIFNDVYKSVNGNDLGDQLQSMAIFNGFGYLVIQNSQKIEVVDIANFKSIATIESSSLSSPRYFVAINAKKAYISDWNADALVIIDLRTNQVAGSIAVGSDPDQMVLTNGYLFVANSGYASTNNNDNRISVIDTATDKLIQHINVGDRPLSMAVDQSGKLWVACAGFKKYNNQGEFSAESTAGSLYQINPSNFKVEKNFTFPNYDDNPKNLAINPVSGDVFYTNKGKVYKQTTEGETLEKTLVIDRNFSGLAFENKNNFGIIGCESPNYTSSGKIIFYNNKFLAFDSATVGIGPNAIISK